MANHDESDVLPNNKTVNAGDIQHWIVTRLSIILNVQPEKISIHDPLSEYGLESIEAFTLSGDLSEWLGRRLSPSLAWDFPTISSLAQYIASLPETTD